ncbi:GntR family transcriptional regulator [Gluconobacter wancherniae]|uniref:GntR family transcriptional regulator n=1 Tax=Gluconobacter wancherniae TaxID=1307955 RepID=UPI001B8B1EDD|nr:GntR family transcriptional regulator [Gluconobacter wancherniae]MBS1062467.1 GntR family transcriptional regulator [Gluconobacter wancherniae]MBS1088791.1 GntR family transcriptional regulator [Gluconobacter wancherniae]
MPATDFSFALDAHDAVPLYLQMSRHVSGLIGTHPLFMERLPSEADFCQMYGVSRITVRQALAYLAERDIVVRQHGRGTFVGPLHRPGRRSSIISFQDILTEKGLRPSLTLLDFQICTPPEDVAHALSLGSGKAIFIRRGYAANDKPVAVTEVYYPESFSEMITTEMAARMTSVTLLTDVMKFNIDYADVSIGLMHAEQETAKWLQIPKDATLMKIQRITHCVSKGPSEHSRLLVTEGSADFRIDSNGLVLNTENAWT